LIKQIDRIITAHGLVEYRNALAMIVDKFETKTFEIGVFGRVSSGKSSLLNPTKASATRRHRNQTENRCFA
jgi:hypothetical protein